MNEIGRHDPANGKTALMKAVENKNSQIIRLLISHEAGMKDNMGMTALNQMVADRRDQKKDSCVNALSTSPLEMEASWISKEQLQQWRNGETATLKCPRNSEYQKFFEKYYTAAQDAKCQSCGARDLFEAAENGCPACCRKYLKQAGKKSSRMGGKTALMIAAENGFPCCVSLLVDKERTHRAPGQVTALMLASAHGYDACARILAPAELSLKDEHDRTALMYAASCGDFRSQFAEPTQHSESSITQSNGDLSGFSDEVRAQRDGEDRAGTDDLQDMISSFQSLEDFGRLKIANLLAAEMHAKDSEGCNAMMYAVYR